MKIQVNSDKAINVDASLMRIVKEKSTSALERFAKGIGLSLGSSDSSELLAC